ncbi:MAG: LysE family translocator [Pseudomonadota bacterium]
MELSQVLAFNAALLVAMASPGPALLVLTQTALSAGRVRAIWTGVGLALVASLWTVSALLGLDAVFTHFPAAYTIAKTVGPLYLIYIAWTTWRSARGSLVEMPRTAPGAAFRRGAMINLLNPKAVLFVAGVLVVMFPPGLSAGQITFVALNHLFVEVTIYSLLAVALSRPGARAGYLAAKTWLDRMCSVVLGGLGVRLLLDRTP